MDSVKIYICGRGCISNAGDGIEAARRGLFGTVPSPHLPSSRIGTTLELPLFELDFFSGDVPNRTLALLEHVLKEASAFSPELLNRYRTGVCIGTTVACQFNDLDFYTEFKNGNTVSDNPLNRFLTGNPAEYLRRKYGWNGPAATISNACASGADAIALASLWIRTGKCEIAVAGGADELNRVPVAGFRALGVASDEPCKPFDAHRRGLNLGEGAGIVILIGETLKRDLFPDRNFAFLAGCGAAGDAHHITSPEPDGAGLERAIRKALSAAHLVPSDIAFINAHGTGTENNDQCESTVFRRVFGDQLRFFSTKGKTGHTLAAAGAVELIFTELCLEEQRIPASAGFTEKDSAMPLAPVSREMPFAGRFAMSTSLAFGGCNTALIVGREAES